MECLSSTSDSKLTPVGFAAAYACAINFTGEKNRSPRARSPCSYLSSGPWIRAISGF
jgi:hypothetical protein